MLAGVLSGMAMGLFFHQDGWLGGYGSFRRRLLRLGHIAFYVEFVRLRRQQCGARRKGIRVGVPLRKASVLHSSDTRPGHELE